MHSTRGAQQHAPHRCAARRAGVCACRARCAAGGAERRRACGHGCEAWWRLAPRCRQRPARARRAAALRRGLTRRPPHMRPGPVARRRTSPRNHSAAPAACRLRSRSRCLPAAADAGGTDVKGRVCCQVHPVTGACMHLLLLHADCCRRAQLVAWRAWSSHTRLRAPTTPPHDTPPAFARAPIRQASPAQASMHRDQGAWRQPLQLLRRRRGAAAGALAGSAPVTCVTAQAAAMCGVQHCQPQPPPPSPQTHLCPSALVQTAHQRTARVLPRAAAAVGRRQLTALLLFAALLAPALANSGTAAIRGTASTAVSAAARMAPAVR
jgi:hypothetical protein